MNVIRYIKNDFVPNVALVIDFSGEHKMLVGEHIVATSDALSDYQSACKEAKFLYNKQELDTNAYDIYTIDMYGYRTLFCKIDNYVRKAFMDWPNLLAEYRQIDLTSVLRANTCEMSVMSIGTDSYLTAYFDRSLGMQSAFIRNNVYAARLLNVAFPKGLVKGFCHATGNITPNDDDYKAYDEFVNATTTYTLADFKYVDKPTGQQFNVIADDSTRFTIVMTSSDGDYEQVLCDNGTINDLRKLEQYLTISKINDRLYIQFNYNPNRTYTLTSNYHVVEQVTIPSTAIRVLSADMKKHASNADLLYLDTYILLNNLDKPATITIDAVYNKVNCNDMTVRSWRTSDYVYDARLVAANGNWVAANYQFVPVQTNDAAYDINDFKRTVALHSYGNLCTFLIDAVSSLFGQEAAKLHTFAPIDNGFDTALSGIDLPVINDGVVTFRNIRYTMYRAGKVTKEHDGKQFAVVLQHTERLLQNYQEVGGIALTNGAYFNSGLFANDKYSVYIGITPLATYNAHSSLRAYYPFGHIGYADSGLQQFAVTLQNDTGHYMLYYGKNNVDTSLTSMQLTSLGKIDIAMQKNTCTVSCNEALSSASIIEQRIVNTTAPLLIGAATYKASSKSAREVRSGSDMIIHYCRIYEDNRLLRDYVPCRRKSDGLVGLYDIVNGQFLAATKPYNDSNAVIVGEATSLADDTKLTAETSVSANYVICRLRTNLRPLLSASGKRSFDSLTIDDFYRYNAAPYMPRMIASYANLDNGYYCCRATATADVLDIDIPLEPLS